MLILTTFLGLIFFGSVIVLITSSVKFYRGNKQYKNYKEIHKINNLDEQNGKINKTVFSNEFNYLIRKRRDWMINLIFFAVFTILIMGVTFGLSEQIVLHKDVINGVVNGGK